MIRATTGRDQSVDRRYSARMSLDRADGPLYAQVRDLLRGRIEDESYPPGAALPTEEELQAQHGVSRSVVRQALSELAAQGLVVRQRGRGTAVAPTADHYRRLDQAGGLRQQVASTGRTLRTTVVSLDRVTAPSAAARALGTDDAWQLVRTRHVDDEPAIHMRTWVPAHLLAGVTVDDLQDRSLLDLLRSRGHHPQGGPRQVEAVSADGDVAERLGCEVGQPLLLLSGVTRDVTGQGLEWFQAWHRPGTAFDVDAQISPAAGPGRPELERARALLVEVESLLGAAGAD